MVCDICTCMLRITNSYHKAENDNTPDAETKGFNVQELSCVNNNFNDKPCPNKDKVVKTIKHELTLL